MHKFSKCKACSAKITHQMIDFGDQPISSNYAEEYGCGGDHFRLSMALCEKCSTVQLLHHVPDYKLLDPPAWIKYNEPERHLDDVVGTVQSLVGNASCKIKGLSYKDETTLMRLASLGFENSGIIDFKIYDTNPLTINIERLQKLVTKDSCAAVAKSDGRTDVLFVRHILEHTFDTAQFLAGIKELVSDSGLIVFEVPDCSKQFSRLDYTSLWEEHTIYFVKETFVNLLTYHGFIVEVVKEYDYPVENSLVAFCRINGNHIKPDDVIQSNKLNDYLQNIRSFCDNYDKIIKATRKSILNKKNNGSIAIFGAGHLAVTFLNIYKLSEHIDFIIDDDPNKVGKFMPGTKLKIQGSDILNNDTIKTCLITLSPESEESLLQRKSGLFKNIENVHSIFPGKPNSIVESTEK